MKRGRAGALIALALTAATAGCGAVAGGDKAGGPVAGPVVVRMATTSSGLDDIPPVKDFVRRVGMLSDGTLRITMINQWGDYAPSAEARLVRAVAAGTVDLGWVGSRVFDTLGMRSWQALSAPMLIDSYPLESAVLRSGMPGRMLAGLPKIGVTGLGVLGESLRLPFRAHRPLLAPADWRGVSFGTYQSGVQEQAIRALGATPLVAFGPYRQHYLARGEMQGFELDIRRYVRDVGPTGTMYATANLALWPQFDVLIANPRWLASLTAQQRGWLQQAAAAMDSVALAASGSAAYIRQACAIGARFVAATPTDLAAMRRSLSPVYQNLETDPQTRAFIGQIRRLKATTPPGPPLRIPVACTRARLPAPVRCRAAPFRTAWHRMGSPPPRESRGPAGCPR